MTKNGCRDALHWIAVVALWLTIYVCAIATVAAFLMIFMLYQSEVTRNPFESWYIPSAIFTGLLALTAGSRAIWPRLVFTEKQFCDVAYSSGQELSSVGRLRVVRFGGVEVGYYFHRGFVSFPIDWKPPNFQLKRKWIEKELTKNEGWLKAWHVWSIVKLMTPLVIRLPAEEVREDEAQGALEVLESAVAGRRVERWLQRYQGNNVWMRHVTTEDRCTFEQSDDVFLFAYTRPWDSERITAGIRVAAGLGERYRQAKQRGPGWFAEAIPG